MAKDDRMTRTKMQCFYRLCPHCGRYRVQTNGVCEKCLWDVDADKYAFLSRPNEYDVNGPIVHLPEQESPFERNMEATAAQRPWIVYHAAEDGYTAILAELGDGHQERIAVMSGSLAVAHRKRANAALIVKAVNERDDLLDVCKLVAAMKPGQVVSDGLGIMAAAALAKAEA